MLVSDVLRVKGHNVVKIHATDSVELAVRRLAEHRIVTLIVEDRWMKPVRHILGAGIPINAAARDGAAVLSLQVQQLMSTRIISRPLLRSRGCRACDHDDSAHPPLAGDRGQRPEGHREYRRSGETSPRREGVRGERSS